MTPPTDALQRDLFAELGRAWNKTNLGDHDSVQIFLMCFDALWPQIIAKHRIAATPPTTKPNGPYTVGKPEDEDGSTTVLDSSGESLTADEIVTLLNALSQPTSKEPK